MNKVGQGCEGLGETEDDDAVVSPQTESAGFFHEVLADLHYTGHDEHQPHKKVCCRMIDNCLYPIQTWYHADSPARRRHHG